MKNCNYKSRARMAGLKGYAMGGFVGSGKEFSGMNPLAATKQAKSGVLSDATATAPADPVIAPTVNPVITASSPAMGTAENTVVTTPTPAQYGLPKAGGMLAKTSYSAMPTTPEVWIWRDGTVHDRPEDPSGVNAWKPTPGTAPTGTSSASDPNAKPITPGGDPGTGTPVGKAPAPVVPTSTSSGAPPPVIPAAGDPFGDALGGRTYGNPSASPLGNAAPTPQQIAMGEAAQQPFRDAARHYADQLGVPRSFAKGGRVRKRGMKPYHHLPPEDGGMPLADGGKVTARDRAIEAAEKDAMPKEDAKETKPETQAERKADLSGIDPEFLKKYGVGQEKKGIVRRMLGLARGGRAKPMQLEMPLEGTPVPKDFGPMVPPPPTSAPSAQNPNPPPPVPPVVPRWDEDLQRRYMTGADMYRNQLRDPRSFGINILSPATVPWGRKGPMPEGRTFDNNGAEIASSPGRSPVLLAPDGMPSEVRPGSSFTGVGNEQWAADFPSEATPVGGPPVKPGIVAPRMMFSRPRAMGMAHFADGGKAKRSNADATYRALLQRSPSDFKPSDLDGVPDWLRAQYNLNGGQGGGSEAGQGTAVYNTPGIVVKDSQGRDVVLMNDDGTLADGSNLDLNPGGASQMYFDPHLGNVVPTSAVNQRRWQAASRARALRAAAIIGGGALAGGLGLGELGGSGLDFAGAGSDVEALASSGVPANGYGGVSGMEAAGAGSGGAADAGAFESGYPGNAPVGSEYVPPGGPSAAPDGFQTVDVPANLEQINPADLSRYNIQDPSGWQRLLQYAQTPQGMTALARAGMTLASLTQQRNAGAAHFNPTGGSTGNAPGNTAPAPGTAGGTSGSDPLSVLSQLTDDQLAQYRQFAGVTPELIEATRRIGSPEEVARVRGQAADDVTNAYDRQGNIVRRRMASSIGGDPTAGSSVSRELGALRDQAGVDEAAARAYASNAAGTAERNRRPAALAGLYGLGQQAANTAGNLATGTRNYDAGRTDANRNYDLNVFRTNNQIDQQNRQNRRQDTSDFGSGIRTGLDIWNHGGSDVASGAYDFLSGLFNKGGRACKGGVPKKFYSGGEVNGPGDGTVDTVPAKLANGEMVVNAEGTAYLDKVAPGLLEKANAKGLAIRNMRNGGRAASRGLGRAC